MKNYIFYDSNGEIKVSGICSDDDFILQNRENLTKLEVVESLFCELGYILDNSYIPYTESQKTLKENKPYYPAEWNNKTMSWIDLRSNQEKLEQQLYINQVRRDHLLQASDWRVIKAADIGVPLSQEWKDYRQALRDITTQSDPFNIIWPTAPA